MTPSLMKYANTVNAIDRANGKKLVRVFKANPSCCPQCRAMNGRTVTVDNPQLCTHPHCRCSITKEYK
jgi:hypothetical protein